MSTLYDVHDIISAAATNETLRTKAIGYFMQQIPLALEAKERRGLHASHAGECVRKLWAELHDKLPKGVDPDTQLTRFDLGNLYGAWIGALFKTGIEAHNPGLEVHLEPECDHDGVQGHVDCLVVDAMTGEPLWVVELKTTYSPGPDITPFRFQQVQAGKYALAHNVEDFTVYITAPATQWRRGEKPVRGFQFDDLVSAWRQDIDAEFSRLKGALVDKMPEPDIAPNEKWRCRECRLTMCYLNPNYTGEEQVSA